MSGFFRLGWTSREAATAWRLRSGPVSAIGKPSGVGLVSDGESVRHERDGVAEADEHEELDELPGSKTLASSPHSVSLTVMAEVTSRAEPVRWHGRPMPCAFADR